MAGCNWYECSWFLQSKWSIFFCYVIIGDSNSNPHGQLVKSREDVYQERNTVYANAKLNNILI